MAVWLPEITLDNVAEVSARHTVHMLMLDFIMQNGDEVTVTLEGQNVVDLARQLHDAIGGIYGFDYTE